MKNLGDNVVLHPRAGRMAASGRDLLDSVARLERALDDVERMAVDAGEKIVLRLVRSYRTELRSLCTASESPQMLAVRSTDLLGELREFESWFRRYSGLRPTT